MNVRLMMKRGRFRAYWIEDGKYRTEGLDTNDPSVAEERRQALAGRLTSERSISKRPNRRQRGYAMAQQNNFVADWLTSQQSGDSEILNNLSQMRNRARSMERDNSYARRFVRETLSNVLGPTGINLQVKARNRKGQVDKESSQKVEAAWAEWGTMENASVTKDQTLVEMQEMALRSCVVDGDHIIRIVPAYDNEFSFALQLIEADHLDHDFNINLSNGNQIRMGIEKDRWGKPVAYHLWNTHPGDTRFSATSIRGDRIRVLADDIIFLVRKERTSQSRGASWLHAAAIELRHVNRYMEAEIVASRVAAAKMGFIQNTQDGPSADYPADDVDTRGPIEEVEPGMIVDLPAGKEFVGWDPTHPGSNVPSFIKVMLRSVAAGFGISYNTLANDLEGVNFSSLRWGTVAERRMWQMVQWWFIRRVMKRVYERWLEIALLNGNIDAPFSSFDKLNAPVWQPPVWDWFDPKKDAEAAKIAIAGGFKTRSSAIRERGGDPPDVFEELLAEEQILTGRLTESQPAVPSNSTSGPPDEDGDEGEDD